MASSSQSLLLLLAAFLFLVAFSSPAAVASSDRTKRTHIRAYVHERFSGPNATVATVAPSPLGNDSTFGEVGALDDELRAGPDAASALVGRYRGVFVGSDLAGDDSSISAVTIVFAAGSEHRGSTLSLQGQYSFPGEDGDAVERAVVGGTGRFRMARGYSVLRTVSTQPEAAVFQLDLFVFTSRGEY